MTLLAGSGNLGPGGHTMPFAITLPPGLPASFSFKQGDTWAYIKYKVKVLVDQVGLHLTIMAMIHSLATPQAGAQ